MVVLTSEFSSLVFPRYSFPRSGLELLGLVFRLWFRPWIRMPVAAAAACFFAASMLQFFSSLYSFFLLLLGGILDAVVGWLHMRIHKFNG